MRSYFWGFICMQIKSACKVLFETLFACSRNKRMQTILGLYLHAAKMHEKLLWDSICMQKKMHASYSETYLHAVKMHAKFSVGFSCMRRKCMQFLWGFICMQPQNACNLFWGFTCMCRAAKPVLPLLAFFEN